jgi:hypothetical protein
MTDDCITTQGGPDLPDPPLPLDDGAARILVSLAQNASETTPTALVVFPSSASVWDPYTYVDAVISTFPQGDPIIDCSEIQSLLDRWDPRSPLPDRDLDDFMHIYMSLGAIYSHGPHRLQYTRIPDLSTMESNEMFSARGLLRLCTILFVVCPITNSFH